MFQKKDIKKPSAVFWIILAFLFLSAFGVHKYFIIVSKLNNTEIELTQTTEQGRQSRLKITKLEVELLELGYDKEKLTTLFRNEISQNQQTIQDLDKLSKTDPQLLEKYSKVFFLNENYVPSALDFIEDRYLDSKTKQQQQILDKVWPHLKKILDDSATAGINLTVASAYRSFSEQSSIKSSYKVIYGARTANNFSADQGYSEHQLGTTVDFNTKGKTAFEAFEKTASYTWLVENAYRYGFVLSYPKGNVYYQFEPWHWRFVGLNLARDLRDQNKFFYDLEQRDINKYLLNIFD